MADQQQYYYGTGRRKSAIARVRLFPGGRGELVVNGKALDEVFVRPIHRAEINEPFKRLGVEGKFSAQIICRGGGVTGWAGAIRLGIARALVEADGAVKPALKRGQSLLTRDARVKERKKPGLKRARKAPQFTKR